MAWDVRGALLKKQETESARVADFGFRQRARTMRLLAEALGLEREELVGEIALHQDEVILAELAPRFPDLYPTFERCRAEAYRQLVEELGDPSPHRLV